jgi:sarcosine oxidase
VSKSCEILILGLGAVGSAAAYQLAKRGVKVIGIDHTEGSSHGESRIIRQAIGEDIDYVPLVLRSYEIWEEIEKETAKKLLTITGCLIMTSVEPVQREFDFFQQTLEAAKIHHIAHSLLDARVC